MRTLRWLLAFLSACLVCALPGGALSEAPPLAAALTEALAGTPYAGYAVLRCCYGMGDDQAYAIASSAGRNVLCAFARADGGWAMRLSNESAVYPGAELPNLYSEGSILSLSYDAEVPILAIEFSDMSASAELDRTLRQVFTSSDWEMGRRPLRIAPLGDSAGESRWKVSGYFEDMTFVGWPAPRMSDFDIHAFPESVEEAEAAWRLESSAFIEYASDADLLQMVPSLTATLLQLPKGQSFDVYSGPGSAYLRGAGGKARVSTNGPLYLYGTAGEWALVSYAITGGERYGYIPARALEGEAQAQPLRKSPVDMGFIRVDTAALRDIPDRKSEPLRALARGDELRVLGVLADWLYVDDSPTNPGSPCRGFVWFSELTFGANY